MTHDGERQRNKKDQFPSMNTGFFSHFLFFLILFILSASAVACVREGQTPKPAIIAMVNGEAISMDQFNSALKEISPGEDLDETSAEFKISRKEVLDQLIEKTVLLQEAKQRGIEVSQREVQKALKQVKGNYSDSDFNLLLQASGLTPEGWKQNVTENLLIEKLTESAMANAPIVSEDEIKEYYKQHRMVFKKKEEVRVRQIAVATEEEAKTLRQELLNGADFADLASEHSISPDQAAGGDLGFFSKGDMPKQFDIVFDLKLKTISRVVKSPYGYHIFEVTEKRPPRFQPIDEVREGIHQQLLNEKQERFHSEWVRDLKSKADIHINSALLLKQNAS
jgi:peptidyl-prolyl cis-trans isomerase C